MALIYNTSKGDVAVNREALAAVPTPAPQGPRHRPVGFGEYLDTVQHAFARNGLEFRQEEYALTEDRQTFFGLVEVGALEGELITAKEWNLLVGLRGSHNQNLARGFVVGTQVLVCSNLCFHGNIAEFRTKQTTNVWDRLPYLVNDAVARIPLLAREQERRTDALRTFDLKPRWGDAALVEVFRRGGLTAAQLGRAVTEWHEPSYEAHAEDGFTAWRLLQACTEAQKPTGERVNLELVAQRTQVASTFIDEVIGFKAAA